MGFLDIVAPVPLQQLHHVTGSSQSRQRGVGLQIQRRVWTLDEVIPHIIDLPGIDEVRLFLHLGLFQTPDTLD